MLACALHAFVSRPAIIAFFAFWTVGWDIAMHEGALFRDYAGLTSPEMPGLFFRWTGPGSSLEMLERLSMVSASHAPALLLAILRLVHIAATLSLVLLVCRSRSRR
ncbi:MAG: hypothetical protein ABI689_04620 [Thermoanaerobaculia bacterium]